MLRQLLLDARPPLADSAAATVRAQVFAFVDEKRAEGWSAQQIIVAVKRIADEAGLHASSDVVHEREPVNPRDALLIDLVGWTVDRYFGRGRRIAAQPGVETNETT